MNDSEDREDRSERRVQRHRTERRSTRRVARRRKSVKRLFVAVVPAIVVIAGVVALLIILGGRAEDSGAAVSSTTISTVAASAQAQTGSILVAIVQDDTVPALVLLSRTADGGVALGLPGVTLVKTTEDGFPTAGDLYSHQKTGALTAGLKRDLGTDLKGVAGVGWTALLKALGQAGSKDTWLTTIGSDPAGAVETAGAFLSMAGLSTSAGSGAWAQLEISGDASGVRAFVGGVADGVAAGSWAAAVLPGVFKENLDSKWYEPDTASAKGLLKGGVISIAKAGITLQIENGSGLLDAAQSAGARLDSLGYKTLPYQNAEGFPDVEKTSISAALDALTAAEKVKETLGVGVLSEDDTLASGYIRVIVGSDFAPSTTEG